MTLDIGAATGPTEGMLTLTLPGPAMTKIFGGTICHAIYHVPPPLRDILYAINTCALPQRARILYREAKGLELLCETIAAVRSGTLVPAVLVTRMSAADTARVHAARELIDTQCSDRWTLDGLARACGLNRTKLTRGFREIYGCTVGDALAERRFYEAKGQLRSTDLHIATISFGVGYQCHAAFARAFLKRFGVSPQQYRMQSRSTTGTPSRRMSVAARERAPAIQ